jgi:hypothetical protein
VGASLSRIRELVGVFSQFETNVAETDNNLVDSGLVLVSQYVRSVIVSVVSNLYLLEFLIDTLVPSEHVRSSIQDQAMGTQEVQLVRSRSEGGLNILESFVGGVTPLSKNSFVKTKRYDPVGVGDTGGGWS